MGSFPFLIPATRPAHLEALLKVVVLFKEETIINDNLRGGDAQVQNAVIHSFSRLWRPKERKQMSKLSTNHIGTNWDPEPLSFS